MAKWTLALKTVAAACVLACPGASAWSQEQFNASRRPAAAVSGTGLHPDPTQKRKLPPCRPLGHQARLNAICFIVHVTHKTMVVNTVQLHCIYHIVRIAHSTKEVNEGCHFTVLSTTQKAIL